eukprot:gene6766-7476_t
MENDTVTNLNIGVIGAGAFGTALAEIAARNGNDVKILTRKKEVMDTINYKHFNPHYLSEFPLNEKIHACIEVDDILIGCDLLILALPTQTIPNWLKDHKEKIPKDLLICNTAKGLYLAENCLLSEAIDRAMGREQPYAILSGPSFAKELMLDRPTAVVVASKYLYHAVKIQRALSTMTFRCYPSQDVIGVQLGGALKNPLAIGAGVIEGMDIGINTMAAYLTRSSLELQALCQAMGGEPQTISGLSGVGDLILTAFGELSRNRSMGVRLSRGEKVEDIVKAMTVEGVPTALVAVKFAKQCGLDLPIFQAVADLIHGTLPLDEAHIHLMGRPVHEDVPFPL